MFVLEVLFLHNLMFRGRGLESKEALSEKSPTKTINTGQKINENMLEKCL